jgi:hypothetical protein
MMSFACPRWPCSLAATPALSTSTVMTTYGLVALPVAWQSVTL